MPRTFRMPTFKITRIEDAKCLAKRLERAQLKYYLKRAPMTVMIRGMRIDTTLFKRIYRPEPEPKVKAKVKAKLRGRVIRIIV